MSRAISSKKTRKIQKISKTQQQILAQRCYGDEPLLSENEMTPSQLTEAYNYYNAMFDPKERIEWLVDYLEKVGRIKDSIAIKNMSWRWVNLTACTIARLLSRHAILPSCTIDRFNQLIKETLSKSSVVDDNENVEIIKPRLGIQDYIKDKTSDIIGEIEGIIDDHSHDDFRSFIVEKEVTAAIARKVVEKFRPRVNELKQVISKDDSSLNEGYKTVSTKEIKYQLATAEKIVDQFSAMIENKKRERKPRKKKIVTTEKKLKHFVWLKQSNEYNITSVQPTNIIGATELWTFNTKYNILTVFRSNTGLEVKRRYIVNFDEGSTVSKRIGRKTQERLNEVLKSTKPQLRKLMNTINADPCKLQDMIGENTLLLRVVK